MLVLSMLIILALGVAVASFFIAGTEWLLLVSVALIVLAFYVSRRTARGAPEPDLADPSPPAPGYLNVSNADPLMRPEPQPRPDDEPDTELPDAAGRQSEAGRAIAS